MLQSARPKDLYAYLIVATVLQGHGKDASANVGMNSALVTVHVLVEHVLGGTDDLVISRQSCTAKQHCFELLLNVAIFVRECPAPIQGALVRVPKKIAPKLKGYSHSVCLGANKRQLELLQPVSNSLVLKNPGSRYGSQTCNDLVPYNKLRLRIEAL